MELEAAVLFMAMRFAPVTVEASTVGFAALGMYRPLKIDTAVVDA